MSHPRETLINEEVKLIFNSMQDIVKYSISCIIHTPLGDVKALFITDFSLLRDYVNKFSDVITLNATFGRGMVNHQIAPSYKQLEATIRLVPLANVPDYVELQNAKIQEYRYRAVLYDNSMELIKSNNESDRVKNISDAEDLVPLQFQLINPIQDQLRIATFGGCIRNANAMDAVRAILTRYSRTALIDQQYAIKGIDVQSGYTNEVRDHILIPHLTPIIRLPMVVNEIVGGFYPTGFQYYLQGQHWYIWSPFNVKAYESSNYSMTVINVPANKLAQAEKTFRLTSTQLIILCTGQVGFQRLSDKTESNLSHGVRFVDANNIVESFGEQRDNKLVVNRQKNVNEFIAQSEVTTNPYPYARESADRITTNYLTQYSDIAMRKGAFLQFTWEHSLDNVIQPGMPVRYIYLDTNMPKQVYGTVIAVESTFTQTSDGIVQQRFANKSIVSLFVDDSVKNETML